MIELLVVLVVLALFSGMVVMSIGDSFQRKLQSEAERLQTLITAAADEAIFSGNEFGFVFEKAAYSVVRYDRATQQWHAAEGQAFKRHVLPDGMVMQLQVDGFAVPVDDPESESELADIDIEERLEAEAGGEVDRRNVADDDDDAEVVRETPQLLALSSGELSVFQIVFEAEEDATRRAAFELFSDGFSLPRIKSREPALAQR
ncbi:MAG: type II secretion system minor pseudopilin GspH [Gammaproteobacteria bacterium]|nr:type II secretion system minor pseudopilin GspH [Gammaproteobacteria bacterium]MBT8151641.1 type II secretion system minor pseudopilin GspH [Gammaproteobacteria bacterium]NNL10205.1 type II secretion system minor pseudopilin GspH [Pseudomonadales bacterium]NNM10667.1 type II secretion system minor pseudopilin GspH [Pseudomonadales bacterium]